MEALNRASKITVRWVLLPLTRLAPALMGLWLRACCDNSLKLHRAGLGAGILLVTPLKWDVPPHHP